MDKELVSSFEAALKRFSTYEKSKPLPSGYAFVPTVNRALRGSREWYKSTWPKHAPGPFDVANVGSWFGDLKGRRIPWVQTKGKSSGFPLVVRGFDSDQASAANKWAQRSMQWRYSFDDVRRQNEVKLAATSSTAIVPYDVGYAAKQSAKYGFVGPMPDESFYGPTRKGATGFEAHATKARLDKIKESFDFAMLDSDKQFIQGAMRDKGWSRDQAEQVYFKNLTENTKWLRLIGKNNPKIAKSLIPIAKTIGKASGLPIVGAFASNPALATITAAISGTSFVLKNADKANEVTKNWRNYENLYGKPTAQQEWNARLAGIKDPAKIAEIYGQLAVNFGGDPDMFLLSQGIALRGMDHKQKQLHAKAFGFTPEMVRLAEIYAGTTPEESDIVDARIYALEREESEGWKSGSGFRKTLRSMQLKLIPFQKDLEARGWSWGKILALANPLMFGGQFVGNEIGNAVWDEVHDTAEIDDRYRAGMYDNSVTNNDASRSVSLQVNVASPQITTTGDPVDFAKGISIIGSRALSEYQSIIENTDTKRKQ